MTDYLARCRACDLRLCDRCTLARYLAEKKICRLESKLQFLDVLDKLPSFEEQGRNVLTGMEFRE